LCKPSLRADHRFRKGVNPISGALAAGGQNHSRSCFHGKRKALGITWQFPQGRSSLTKPSGIWAPKGTPRFRLLFEERREVGDVEYVDRPSQKVKHYPRPTRIGSASCLCHNTWGLFIEVSPPAGLLEIHYRVLSRHQPTAFLKSRFGVLSNVRLPTPDQSQRHSSAYAV